MCLLFAGEKFAADGDAATSTAMKAIQDAAAEESKQRLADKAAKKAAFNAEYDVGELAFVNRTRECTKTLPRFARLNTTAACFRSSV